MTADSVALRARQGAAMRRLASSSALPHEVLPLFVGAPEVAHVASGYARFLRPSEARVSRLTITIYSGGGR